MKKRIILCILLVVLCLSSVSCHAPADQPSDGLPKLDPGNPVSLEIWHYYNGPQKSAFDQLVTEFNETIGLEKGIIVEAFSQGSIASLISNVLDAANKKVGAGDVPDIFAAYPDTAYAVDKLGLAANLDPYFTEEELAQYRPEFIEEGRFDQNRSLKIFPIAKSVELLMLNQTDWDRFAQATGAQLSSLSTWEGLAETAEAYYNWTDSLTPEPNDGKAFFGRDAMANYFIVGSQQLGVELFHYNGETMVLNADKNVIHKIWNNYYLPFIKGYYAAYSRFRSDDAKTGDIIALVGSSTGATYFPENVTVTDLESYPIDCMVLPAPIFEGGEHYAVQQGAGMVVTKSDAKKEYAATIFLKWFTDAERNIAFSVNSGYLPVKKDALDQEQINKILDEAGSAESSCIRLAFHAALQQLEDHTLYTSKAFDGGTQARDILDTSLENKAKADREAVLASMAEGTSWDEAVAQYATEENFEQWYAQLIAALEKIVQ